MKLSTHLSYVVLAMALAACQGSPANQSKDEEGDSSNTDKTDKTNPTETADEDAPADSTGATGQVALGFGSPSAALALLDGETPASNSLKVSDSISLSVARFNIAAIKVKAPKDPTAKEQENEAKTIEEEKTDVQEVEATAGDASASLAGNEKEKDPAVTKAEHQGRHEKIVAAKDKLAEKEKGRNEEQAGRDKGIRFKGPYVFDAIAGAIEGDLPPVDLVDGSYRRVEFQLKRSFDAAADDPLLGNVFVMQGEFTKADQTVVPFEIEWHVAMNFRLKSEDPFSVVAGGENKLSVAFDVAKWFDGVALDTADVDADGTIYVNKKSNRAILKVLHKNMKTHTHFGKDKDGDGKLAPTEAEGAGEDTVDATVD